MPTLREVVKANGGPIKDAAARDLEECEVCWAARGTPCLTSNLEKRVPHPCRKSYGKPQDPTITNAEHEHQCPKCSQTFRCRGKACEGNVAEKEVHCAPCWETFSD